MNSFQEWLAALLFREYTVRKYSYQFFMKPDAPALQSTRLLDQLRERIRYFYYRISTEQIYLYWVRFFICWSARGWLGATSSRHRGAGCRSISFDVGHERKVSASTHKQALGAIFSLPRGVRH